MYTSVIIDIVLLIVILCGIFSYRVNATYQTFGGIISGLATILLFLIAVGTIHF